jgi:hypothetical protein
VGSRPLAKLRSTRDKNRHDSPVSRKKARRGAGPSLPRKKALMRGRGRVPPAGSPVMIIVPATPDRNRDWFGQGASRTSRLCAVLCDSTFNMLNGFTRFRCAVTLGVRAAVIDERERVLLLRHTYTTGWFLPGAGIERGETAEEVLRRELERRPRSRSPRRPPYSASTSTSGTRFVTTCSCTWCGLSRA